MKYLRGINLTILAGAILLNGCATRVDSYNEQQVGTNIEVGKVSTARVGDTIFSEYDYLATDGARVSQDSRLPFGFGWSVRLKSGDILVEGRKKKEAVFCSQNWASFNAFGQRFNKACLADTNNDSLFDKIAFPSTAKIKDPVPYSLLEEKFQISGFKYELLYQGVDESTLRVKYREFKGDLARPAFSQDLTYKLNDDGKSTIHFKDVEIDVLSATNSEIKYRVNSSFTKE